MSIEFFYNMSDSVWVFTSPTNKFNDSQVGIGYQKIRAGIVKSGTYSYSGIADWENKVDFENLPSNFQIAILQDYPELAAEDEFEKFCDQYEVL